MIMKNVLKNKLILITLTLFVGGLIGWLIKPSSTDAMKEESTHLHEESNDEIWTCSMHPQIRKNEPGDCPICGMELIPLSTDIGNEENPDAIRMSPTAMKLANVQTAIVSKGSAIKQIRLTGKITPDERAVFSQTAHVSGRIEQLKINFTGEAVNKGQVIATIYSSELVTAQEELLIAYQNRESQPELLKASKEKLKNLKLTDKQINEFIKSGIAIDQFSVLSDLNGVVTEIMANRGDYIKQGTPFYEVADLTKLWVLLDIHESDLAWISKGDQVSFKIKAFANETFTGKVNFIDPIINPKTRVAKARIDIDNSNLKLKPEMLVTATIESDLQLNENTIVVPKSAVMWTGERSVVYVKTSSGNGLHFIMREVDLGVSLGETYVIRSGLVEGEEIAVNGTFSIDAAAQLAGKRSMMNPEGGKMNLGHNHGKDGGSMKMDDSKEMESEQTVLNSTAKKALIPVYESYFKLKDALTEDDLTTANQATIDLKKSLKMVDMKLFKDEEHQVWMDFNKELKAELNEAKDIEQIRNSFINISKTMIGMNGTFQPMDYPIYIQHCPMANNNKGADWLSKNKEVKNPFFGNSMLSCGEVKQEAK
jgi:Cu(I)/Ag(I) efflux system membrane fusion protein